MPNDPTVKISNCDSVNIWLFFFTFFEKGFHDFFKIKKKFSKLVLNNFYKIHEKTRFVKKNYI